MTIMADAACAHSNFDRLAQQLKAGSLAARLVGAYVSVPAAAQQAALKGVTADRLNELRQVHAGNPNQ